MCAPYRGSHLLGMGPAPAATPWFRPPVRVGNHDNIRSTTVVLGPLPPGPWHAVCHDRPVGASAHRALRGHRAVPCHGHDVLAAPDGSGAGAGRGTVRACGHAGKVLALRQWETGEPWYGGIA